MGIALKAGDRVFSLDFLDVLEFFVDLYSMKEFLASSCLEFFAFDQKNRL